MVMEEKASEMASETASEMAPSPVTPSIQLETIWKHISQRNSVNTNDGEEEKRSWPHYKTIMDDITNADYTQVLECPHDIVNESRNATTGTATLCTGKAFCAHGVAVCAKFELFPRETNGEEVDVRNYTGLLRPGQSSDNCIIRLSSAMKPPANESGSFGKFVLNAAGGKLKHAQLFPMAAIKVLRGNGIRSGNLLFAGPKIVSSLLFLFDLKQYSGEYLCVLIVYTCIHLFLDSKIFYCYMP